MSHASSIAPAGRYLVSVLTAEGAVPYSRFYDHSPGRDREVAEGILAHKREADEGDLESLLEEGHILVEWAASQLEDFGAVKISPLPSMLVDGEPDFLLELTARGRLVAEGTEPFSYRSLDSGFLATEASEWLVAFAGSNSDMAESFAFDTVRDLGFADGDVKIVDNGGNVYPPGTRPYDWAFEVALWHHVRSGDFLLEFETDEQGKSWAAFMARSPRLFRHDEFPADCLNVQYGLTEKARANAGRIQRLGWIGRE